MTPQTQCLLPATDRMWCGCCAFQKVVHALILVWCNFTLHRTACDLYRNRTAFLCDSLAVPSSAETRSSSTQGKDGKLCSPPPRSWCASLGDLTPSSHSLVTATTPQPCNRRKGGPHPYSKPLRPGQPSLALPPLVLALVPSVNGPWLVKHRLTKQLCS